MEASIQMYSDKEGRVGAYYVALGVTTFKYPFAKAQFAEEFAQGVCLEVAKICKGVEGVVGYYPVLLDRIFRMRAQADVGREEAKMKELREVSEFLLVKRERYCGTRDNISVRIDIEKLAKKVSEMDEDEKWEEWSSGFLS